MTTKPDGAELFTIEQSHDKPSLTRPRPSDLGAVDTAGERSRGRGPRGRFAKGNKIATDRGAKKANTASLKAARARVKAALRAATDPGVADQLLSDALAIHEAVKRDLGATSMLVLGPTKTFAVQSVLGGHFTNLAAEAGLHTKRGLALLDAAHKCEGRAERAMTAAIAASKALTGAKPDPYTADLLRQQAEFQRRLAERTSQK